MDERKIERGIDAAADKAKSAAVRTEHAMEKTGDKIREDAQHAKNVVREGAEKAGDKMHEGARKVGDKIQEGSHKAGDKLRETG